MEVTAHCDLGRIVAPAMERWRIFRKRSCEDEGTFRDRPILELCVDWDGPPQDHALAPGRYRLRFMLSCAHNPPIPKEMELHFTGAWPKEQSELWQLVTVAILNDTPT